MISEAREVETVQYTLLRHTSFARHFDSPVRELYFINGMRVGIDAEYAAELEGALVPASIEVEAPWVAVDFHSHAVLGAGSQDSFDVARGRVGRRAKQIMKKSRRRRR
jgi:hypothetical protein